MSRRNPLIELCKNCFTVFVSTSLPIQPYIQKTSQKWQLTPDQLTLFWKSALHIAGLPPPESPLGQSLFSRAAFNWQRLRSSQTLGKKGSGRYPTNQCYISKQDHQGTHTQ